jgi:amino acid adenylation domain-containing protein
MIKKDAKQLSTWNENTQAYPLDRSIPALIADQAMRTPVAVALTMGDQSMLYASLNQRANQLAHWLLALGVQTGTLVGICAERSLDVVVGMLGILKAGGAYVPLDPAYPRERLEFMVRDASLAFLVTQQHIASSLPLPGVHCIFLDDDPFLAEDPNENPDVVIRGEDLAYTIYTSGSTGQPKGVQVTHEGLLNLIFWHRHAFAITSFDRATQVSSIAFDATGWELWPYLTAGAQVAIADEKTRLSPHLLRDWLIENHITITFLSTPLAEEMIQLNWPASISLRYLLTGADKLRRYPPSDLPFTLINNYGPTETTVVASSGPVLPGEYVTAFPPIGYPISNTQIYILDEHLQHVPVGVTGEIYIGGAGVAKGYINRPDLTAERFIPHPFSTDPCAHVYKTNDLAYYLPDGQIAFVGRNDQQVKIRGFRIEPGEIETILNHHPEVKRAVVLDKEDLAGNKQLVAYIQPYDLSVLTESAALILRLRQMLASNLPGYMVPELFVPLAEFPLTYNGKIDQAALIAASAPEDLRDLAPDRSENGIEQKVAKIIMFVLQREQIAPDDNFFMMGGHSLLGTQVIAHVAQAFGVDLPLRTLFDAPTVRLLSVEIENLIVTKVAAMSEDEVLQLLDT